MFFLTTAPSGQNSYGCVALNTWAPQSVGASITTIENSGALVGAGSIMDFSAGRGNILATSGNGTEISVQNSADTSVLLTRGDQQAGITLFCASNSSGAPGVTYVCAMNPTLTAYTAGMTINWKPDVNGAGGAMTLNVDTLGAISLFKVDGVTAPGSSDIAAGQLYQLWYDGAVFRIFSSGSGSSGTGLTGPAGPAGPTGATGATGPTGLSGAAYLDYQNETGPVTMNGSPQTVYTGAAPITLPAGGCLTIDVAVTGTGAAAANATIAVYADSTLIHTVFASGSLGIMESFHYCNTSGSTTQQRLFYPSPVYYGSSGTLGYNAIGTSDGLIPAAVTWGSTTHTLSLMATATGGTVSGAWWMVAQ